MNKPDTTTQAPPSDTWGLDIFMRVLATRRKLDDDVLFDDADLVKHIDGTQPFDEAEWRAVLASPLTLRRLDALAEALSTQRTAPPQEQAMAPRSPLVEAAKASVALAQGLGQRLQQHVVDWFTPSAGHWAGAHMREQGAMAIVTSDERWKLSVLPAVTSGVRARLVLQLNPEDPWVKLWADDIQVQVLDHHGQVLLQGRLDEDNQLSGEWPLQAEPAPYLAARGAGITVQQAPGA